MIRGKLKERISLKAILEKVSEYDIYRYYLGYDFVINSSKLLRSPFRKEEKGSFGVFVSNQTGVLYHNDFGDSTKKGTVIDFIKQLFEIDYYNALCKIDQDFNLGLSFKPNSGVDYKQIISEYNRPDGYEPKKDVLIQITTRKFNNDELAYWNQYNISYEELKRHSVFAIDKLFINKRLIGNYTKTLRFAYLYGKYLKIYSPYDPKYKWITNTPIDYISNLEVISDRIDKNIQSTKVLVTKSKKDEIVMSKFFDDVCSTQNESSVAINSDNITLLQENYSEIIINFDSDEPGVNNCKYYNQFGFGYLNVDRKYLNEGIKDFSDLAKVHGIGKVEEELKKKNLI